MALDIDTNNLMRMNAENDKNTSLQVNVFQGNAALTIFSSNKVALRIPLSTGAIAHLKLMTHKFLTMENDVKIPVTVRKWDQGQSKLVTSASLEFGRTDKGTPYLSVSAPGFQPTKFFFRSDSKFIIEAGFSDRDKTNLGLIEFIEVLATYLPIAMVVTKAKRDFKNGGGNRQGGGGYSGGGQKPATSDSFEDSMY